MITKITLSIAIVGAGMGLTRGAFAQHAGDIWIGQSAGRVAIHPGGLEPGVEYLELFRVEDPFAGWSNNEPGFEAAESVLGSIAPLPDGAEIYLRVVWLDPALLVIDGAFDVLADPGDSTLLGDHQLHAHVTFFVDENEPGFDSDLCAWEGIFVLEDDGAGLADSQPFSLLFSIVPIHHDEENFADGDYTGEGIVNLADWGFGELCLAGPVRRPAADDHAHTTCEVDCVHAFDFDGDLDVDLEDYAEFQLAF